MLHMQMRSSGLAADIVRETRTLMAVSPEWLLPLSAEQRAAETRAQVEILHAIKQHLDGSHAGHSNERRYIASRAVVVTGPTDDDGVSIKCNDPICRAWYRRDEGETP
jgi:hypothetical protein